jgi:hypothetical protein
MSKCEYPEERVYGLDEDECNYRTYEDKRSELIAILERQVNSMLAQMDREENLREKHPALQDAWEAYRIILRTVQV